SWRNVVAVLHRIVPPALSNSRCSRRNERRVVGPSDENHASKVGSRSTATGSPTMRNWRTGPRSTRGQPERRAVVQLELRAIGPNVMVSGRGHTEARARAN